jgi:glycosyltransferase involved in cell wall biosynthesis
MIDSSYADIVIIYFGKRGGGKVFTEDFVDDFPIELGNVLWLCGTNTLNLKTKHNKLILETPRNLFSVSAWIIFTRGLLNLLVKVRSGPRTIIFSMCHPIDLLVHRMLRINRENNFIWVIHDFNLHPGDAFPSTEQVSKRINRADGLVFLSKYVAELARPIVPKKTKLFLSPLFSKPRGDLESTPILAKPYILIIGRIKRYKGIEEFLRIWETLSIQEDLRLVIAGENANEVCQPGFDEKKIELIDRWLEDEEVWNLISNSSLVVLPYIEASQSGIASIAIACGTPAIYTSAGALPEQFESIENAFPFEWSNNSVETALSTAFKMGRRANRVNNYQLLWRKIVGKV